LTKLINENIFFSDMVNVVNFHPTACDANVVNLHPATNACDVNVQMLEQHFGVTIPVIQGQGTRCKHCISRLNGIYAKDKKEPGFCCDAHASRAWSKCIDNI
jgi:hypothetical protein